MFYQPVQPSPIDPEKARREREQQVRQHYQSKMTAFIIPALQSSFTGLLAGLLVGSLLWAFNFGNPLKTGFISGVIVWALTWAGLVANWTVLVWRLETALHADLTGDKEIGRPGETFKIELKRSDGEGKKVEYRKVPTSPEKMAEFARAALAGTNLSETYWAGSGATFSQKEYTKLRNFMISEGWARWKDPQNPRAGYEFTGVGKAVLRSFAHPSPTPQPVDPEE